MENRIKNHYSNILFMKQILKNKLFGRESMKIPSASIYDTMISDYKP